MFYRTLFEHLLNMNTFFTGQLISTASVYLKSSQVDYLLFFNDFTDASTKPEFR